MGLGFQGWAGLDRESYMNNPKEQKLYTLLEDNTSGTMNISVANLMPILNSAASSEINGGE